MAAEVHFDRRREPAQMIKVFFCNKVSGFREIVLGGDTLEKVVRQPTLLRQTPAGLPLNGFEANALTRK
jgi:hypothetical protein